MYYAKYIDIQSVQYKQSGQIVQFVQYTIHCTCLYRLNTIGPLLVIRCSHIGSTGAPFLRMII